MVHAAAGFAAQEFAPRTSMATLLAARPMSMQSSQRLTVIHRPARNLKAQRLVCALRSIVPDLGV